MPDDLRISADELKQRMKSGEEFTPIDARNPQAWADAPEMAEGAIRVPADASDAVLTKIPKDKRIVTYCT
jgi:rhodanese-related sulfurtransferase